nr:proline-rich receptor-like protein kinase PERK2 [Columba livia]
MGRLSRYLARGEYGHLRDCPLFESDFLQVRAVRGGPADASCVPSAMGLYSLGPSQALATLSGASPWLPAASPQPRPCVLLSSPTSSVLSDTAPCPPSMCPLSLYPLKYDHSCPQFPLFTPSPCHCHPIPPSHHFTFPQVTCSREATSQVTVASAATSPLLPCPNLLLLAQLVPPSAPNLRKSCSCWSDPPDARHPSTQSSLHLVHANTPSPPQWTDPPQGCCCCPGSFCPCTASSITSILSIATPSTCSSQPSSVFSALWLGITLGLALHPPGAHGGPLQSPIPQGPPTSILPGTGRG